MRRIAFDLHKNDKRPSMLKRVLRKIRVWTLLDKSEIRMEMYQEQWAPGFRNTYKALKRAYKTGGAA